MNNPKPGLKRLLSFFSIDILLTSLCMPPYLFIIFLPRLDFAMLARLAAAKPCTSLGASVIRSIRIWTPEILHESMNHEKMNTRSW